MDHRSARSLVRRAADHVIGMLSSTSVSQTCALIISDAHQGYDDEAIYQETLRLHGFQKRHPLQVVATRGLESPDEVAHTTRAIKKKILDPKKTKKGRCGAFAHISPSL